jgi:dihydrodiol dehydrogenase / D-xylose 1-dehydrogenase (NADP)
MSQKINWGILGAGGIAHRFVEALNSLDDAVVTAVGSRSLERADAFGNECHIPKCYGSYQDLVNDAEVDIIYIATRHPDHKAAALLSLKARKAVICEKPFTVNAKELAEVIWCARESRVFLMEAMWTRFLPAAVKVREWLAEGVIGEIRQVRADLGFRAEWNPKSRLLDAELGGGALLDVGIYPLSYAMMVMGSAPSSIASMAHIGSTGVDEQFSALLGFEGGKFASISGAVRTQTAHDAWIYGTEGYIHIPDFWHAQSAKLCLQGKPVENYDMPFEGVGFKYEAQEAMNCLRAGKLESDVMPLDESLAIMKTMDAIRGQWDLKYPCE